MITNPKITAICHHSWIKALLLSGLIWSGSWLWGVQAQGMSTQKLANLSERFINTIQFDATQIHPEKIQQIIYGHRDIGFFKTSSWRINSQKQLEMSFVAPSYKRAIHFYVQYKNGPILSLGQQIFTSPTPKIFTTNIIRILSGNLSSPFYLLNGALPRKALIQHNFKSDDPELFRRNHHRFTYVMIINRLGEIVWIHVPVIDDSLFSSYLSSKEVGQGYYGLMFGKHSGYFEIVKYSGEVMRDFSSKDTQIPFVMHHDFETLGAKKLFAVGNEQKKLYPFTRNPAHKGQSFVSDTIIGIDLVKGQSRRLMGFTSWFHPGITPFVTGDREGDKKFVMWGAPKADFDFLHINGLDYVSEWDGVLVSFRNISKVGLLDSQFQKMLWTLGSENSDTYTIHKTSDQFVHQHTPFVTSQNTLMLFDNSIHRKRSRVVEYQLTNRGAELIWEYEPSTPLFSKDRSSVHPLQGDRFGIYFVKPLIGQQKRASQPHKDIYIEVNRQKKETAVVSITFPVASPGYRMRPVSTISDDQALEHRELIQNKLLQISQSHSNRITIISQNDKKSD